MPDVTFIPDQIYGGLTNPTSPQQGAAYSQLRLPHLYVDSISKTREHERRRQAPLQMECDTSRRWRFPTFPLSRIVALQLNHAHTPRGEMPVRLVA